MNRRDILPLLLGLLLGGCVSPDVAKQQAPAQNSLQPPGIAVPALPQLEQQVRTGKGVVGDFHSFYLREADVKDVLRAMGKQTNYNVVIEPDVKGSCTVDLKNVTLVKALEYILEPLGFVAKIEGHTIYVSKPKVETRVFHLNYVTLRRMGFSSVTGTTGGGTSTSGGTAGTGSTSGASSGTGSSSGGETVIALRTLTESDVWKSLEDNMKGLLSSEGRFFVNKQALMIFVTDYPNYLKNIELLLKSSEEVMHRQVMIEAKIIEVQLSESSREGVNWDLIQARIGEFMIAMNQTFLNPTMLVVPSTKPTASVPYFRFFVGNKNLDINNTFIDLLRTQGKVKVVSNPKVATLNNQRAVIKVARQDVYFEEQQSQGSGGSQNLTTYTPKFITIGLILDVIPQIDSQGNVLMDIHPVLTEKVGVVRSPGGSEVPVLDMRETDTMVRLRDGETVIIGGLIKDYSKKDMTGTKYLESLPLVGKFFRLDQEESLRSELVVVLTPRIVWDREVR